MLREIGVPRRAHATTILGVVRERHVDDRPDGGSSGHDRDIALHDIVPPEGVTEGRPARGRPRGEEDARRAGVEAMHETARQRIADGSLRGVARDEPARDGSALARIERMAANAAGLVDRDEVGILVQDVERHGGIGDDAGELGQVDQVTGDHPGAFARGPRFRAYSLVTLALFVATAAVTFSWAGRIANGQPTPWLGAVERVMIYAYLIWIAALAVSLIRRRDRLAAM